LVFGASPGDDRKPGALKQGLRGYQKDRQDATEGKFKSTYNPEVVQALAGAAAEQLKKCVQECVPPSVPVTSELKTGPPADIIEARVAQKGIERVVLGTHGRSGFSRLLLGPVAERVLRMTRHSTVSIDAIERRLRPCSALLICSIPPDHSNRKAPHSSR
jgi:hypothetical protein